MYLLDRTRSRAVTRGRHPEERRRDETMKPSRRTLRKTVPYRRNDGQEKPSPRAMHDTELLRKRVLASRAEYRHHRPTPLPRPTAETPLLLRSSVQREMAEAALT
jgi:hypothetical protein